MTNNDLLDMVQSATIKPNGFSRTIRVVIGTDEYDKIFCAPYHGSITGDLDEFEVAELVIDQIADDIIAWLEDLEPNICTECDEDNCNNDDCFKASMR